MSRERVRESNSHGGSEWTRVERNRRVTPAMDDKERRRGRQSSKVLAREHLVSIFVDNLPEFYDNGLLRGLFANCGRVMDCFVPWKWRRYAEVRYGFVRFETFKEAYHAIEVMAGRKVEGKPIVVRLLNDQKKEEEGIRKEKDKVVQASSSACLSSKNICDGRSYAGVVGEKSGKPDPGFGRKEDMKDGGGVKGDRGRKVVECLEVVEDISTGNSFIGRVKKCELIKGLGDWFKSKGGFDVLITHLGGPYVRVSCLNMKRVVEGWKGEWVWLDEVFLSVREWNPKFTNPFRIVWLKCMGVPAAIWSKDSFRRIGEAWGEVVEVDNDISDGVNLEGGRVLISTDKPWVINEFIDVVANGHNYVVWIREEDTRVCLNQFVEEEVVDDEDESGSLSRQNKRELKVLAKNVEVLKKRCAKSKKAIRILKNKLSNFEKEKESISVGVEDSIEHVSKTGSINVNEGGGSSYKTNCGDNVGVDKGDGCVNPVVGSCGEFGTRNLFLSAEQETFRGINKTGPVQVVDSFDELMESVQKNGMERNKISKRGFGLFHRQALNVVSARSGCAKRYRKGKSRSSASISDKNEGGLASNDSIEPLSKEEDEALKTMETAKLIGVSCNQTEKGLLEKCIEIESRNGIEIEGSTNQ